MVSLHEAAADSPEARDLLTEYFALRAASFPGGGYATRFPDAAAFVPPAGVFLVLRDDTNDPAGCGGIRRLDATRFEVKHLYVRESGRGRGWGRMLLAALEREARAAGATELVLDTHHTLTAAATLYARSGFTEIEPYNDNPNATVWRGKALTPAP